MQAYASIEFAHTYAAMGMSRSHLLSKKIFDEQAAKLRLLQLPFYSLVLIDDISASESVFNRKKIIRHLARELGQVDRFVFESELHSACVELIHIFNQSDLVWQTFRGSAKKVLFLKLQNQHIALAEYSLKSFSQKDVLDDSSRFNLKPTCACYIAAWYLARLGAIQAVDLVPAQFAISILEERYQQAESRALSIIKSTKYQYLCSRIIQHFYRPNKSKIRIEATKNRALQNSRTVNQLEFCK